MKSTAFTTTNPRGVTFGNVLTVTGAVLGIVSGCVMQKKRSILRLNEKIVKQRFFDVPRETCVRKFPEKCFT